MGNTPSGRPGDDQRLNRPEDIPPFEARIVIGMTAWKDKTPEEVVHAASLTKAQKLAVLHEMELDAEQLAVADQENMAGGERDNLRAASLRTVRQAIRSLENRP